MHVKSAVLCCSVLCCAVLCCAVMCCANNYATSQACVDGEILYLSSIESGSELAGKGCCLAL